MIYYYLYKTINIINGKEYIGVHKTSNLKDGYIGCGICSQQDAKRISVSTNSPFVHAVVKHGYEYFIKEVLYHFDSENEAYKKEEELVNLFYIKRKDTYNTSIGGKGGANIASMKSYDVINEDGNRYIGENIKDFCRLKNLEYGSFKSLISGKTLTSQGYSLTKNKIQTEKIIIVNLLTNNIYETFNIQKWCKENLSHAITDDNKTNYLKNVLLGKTLMYRKTWWCCYEKDWTGEAVIKYVNFTEKNLKKDKVIDDNGGIYEVGNVTEFCKNQKLDTSYFYKLLNKKIKKYKGFKLI